jgi:protein O-mannosyl-transferase
VSVAVLLVLALIARRQINYWQTDEGVWSHAVQVTTGNWFAESQLGSVLAMDGRLQEAMPHYYRAIAIDPGDGTANMGIAIYQLQMGNFSEAIVYYQRVVSNQGEKPGLLANAWVGMAKAYRALGDKEKVRECLEQAKRVPGLQ